MNSVIEDIKFKPILEVKYNDIEYSELDEKTKKVYNILGDYPETIAEFMVEKIINNEKNNVKFTWLTNRKAAWRFMTSGFNKRDFFSK